VGETTYLIRYGVMGHVGRFGARPECSAPLERGHMVVIQTERGLELGEVLIGLEDSPPPQAASQGVLRLAWPEDLVRAQRAQAARLDRFTLCQRMLQEGEWPYELIDVEPLLDLHTTVLHYLGPPQLDVAPLRARFRTTCDFDVVLEPLGGDLQSDAPEATPEPAGGCERCGSTDGGCGSQAGAQVPGHQSPARSDGHGCGTAPHAACASCGISRLLAGRHKHEAACAS
jgi:hypothetical protein